MVVPQRDGVSSAALHSTSKRPHKHSDEALILLYPCCNAKAYKTLFWEDMKKCVFTPHRVPMTDQRDDVTLLAW